MSKKKKQKNLPKPQNKGIPFDMTSVTAVSVIVGTTVSGSIETKKDSDKKDTE